MPTYSGAQREVVIVASSRSHNGTDRGRPSTDLSRSRTTQEDTWREKERARDRELDKRLPPVPANVRQNTADSVATVTGGSGGTTPRALNDADPLLERMETITSRSAPVASPSKQPRPSPVPSPGTQTPVSQPTTTNRAQASIPPNVLRKAGAGTDLQVFRPGTDSGLQPSRHRHQHQQSGPASSAVPRVPSISSAPVPVPTAPAPIGQDVNAQRSRSQSIRKLWKGVIGGAIGGVTGGGGAAAGAMGVHVR